MPVDQARPPDIFWPLADASMRPNARLWSGQMPMTQQLQADCKSKTEVKSQPNTTVFRTRGLQHAEACSQDLKSMPCAAVFSAQRRLAFQEKLGNFGINYC